MQRKVWDHVRNLWLRLQRTNAGSGSSILRDVAHPFTAATPGESPPHASGVPLLSVRPSAPCRHRCRSGHRGRHIDDAPRAGSGDDATRSGCRHRDAHRGARLRLAACDRHGQCRPAFSAVSRRSTCRNRCARARNLDPEPLELCAGSADSVARLRRARHFRRPRRAPVPGRHSGDDAGRPGPDRQLQPGLGAAHRGPARSVLDALRQCVGRRHLRVHRGRTGDAARSTDRSSAAATAPGTRWRRGRRGRSRSTMSSRATTSRPTATAITAKRRGSSPTPSSSSPRAPDTRHAGRQYARTSPRRRIRSASRVRSGRRIRARPIPWRSQFDTRKTVNQQQGGATLEQRVQRRHGPSRHGLRRHTHGPPVSSRLSGIGATSSGGVADLDRTSAASDARLVDALGARRTGRLSSRSAPTRDRSTSSARASSTTTARWATCAATKTTR